MPQIGLQDAFEQRYTNRLKTLLSEHGLLIGYEADRAAIDLGLHLFEPARPGAPRQLGQVRVWFQLKGVRAETIDAHRLADQVRWSSEDSQSTICATGSPIPSRST